MASLWLCVIAMNTLTHFLELDSLSTFLSAVFQFRFCCSAVLASLNTKLIFLVWLAEICFAVQIKVTRFAIDNIRWHTHTPAHPQTPAHTLLLTKCMSLNKLWFIYTHFALCSLALGQSLSSHGKYSAAKQLLPTAFASVLDYLCVCVASSCCLVATLHFQVHLELNCVSLCSRKQMHQCIHSNAHTYEYDTYWHILTPTHTNRGPHAPALARTAATKRRQFISRQLGNSFLRATPILTESKCHYKHYDCTLRTHTLPHITALWVVHG